MSETALVCPHCGSRQADRAWMAPPPSDPPPPLQVSAEEAAAIIQIRGAGALDLDEPAGPLSLVLPRPEAEGWTRAAEWALTALAVPVLVPGFVIALLRLRYVSHLMSRVSENAMTAIIGGFGIAGAASLCMAAGWGAGATAGLVGASAGALLGRWLLRHRT